MSDIARLESTGVEAQICVTLELVFFSSSRPDSLSVQKLSFSHDHFKIGRMKAFQVLAALCGSFLGLGGGSKTVRPPPPKSLAVKQIGLLGGGGIQKHRRDLGSLQERQPVCSWLAGLPLSLYPPVSPPPHPPFPSVVGREGSLSKPRTWVIPESSIACVGLLLQRSLPLQMSESDTSPQGCLHTPC